MKPTFDIGTRQITADEYRKRKHTEFTSAHVVIDCDRDKLEVFGADSAVDEIGGVTLYTSLGSLWVRRNRSIYVKERFVS
jgi:hypothetical protein